MRDLASDAGRLRELHGSPPLVLPNAWDAATARVVEELGFPAVATSSAAVSASRGGHDGDSLDPDLAFDAVAVVSGAVSVPVTADLEAGYRLPPDEFVRRLLAAGAVGCNLEDTDHHGDGVLVDIDAQAARIAAVKEAGRSAGVDAVVNARVDPFIRGVDAPLDVALTRGRAYREAGADCIYPIGAVDEADIAAMVEALGPVNVWLRKGAPSLARLTELGVARVSLAAGLFRLALDSFKQAATRARDGEDWWA